MRKFTTAVAAASLLVAGAASAATPLRASDAVPAAKTVSADSVTRSTQAAKKQSELGGPGLIIGIIAAAAVIAGIIIAADDDDSNG